MAGRQRLRGPQHRLRQRPCHCSTQSTAPAAAASAASCALVTPHTLTTGCCGAKLSESARGAGCPAAAAAAAAGTASALRPVAAGLLRSRCTCGAVSLCRERLRRANQAVQPWARAAGVLQAVPGIVAILGSLSDTFGTLASEPALPFLLLRQAGQHWVALSYHPALGKGPDLKRVPTRHARNPGARIQASCLLGAT